MTRSLNIEATDDFVWNQVYVASNGLGALIERFKKQRQKKRCGNL